MIAEIVQQNSEKLLHYFSYHWLLFFCQNCSMTKCTVLQNKNIVTTAQGTDES